MVERKNGAVINISSLSGVMPSPMLSVYSGTKAYIDFFTQGLTKEYAKTGVTIQCIMPGPVVSNMSKLKRASMSSPFPEVFVKSNLSRLGIDDRTAGFWFHDIMMFVTDSLPRNVVSNFLYKFGQTLKTKALKKKEKQK